jgi:HPt (histidine-containing phosphotransfer) domain-containing protein
MPESIANEVFNKTEALQNVAGMEDLLKDLAQTLIDELPKLTAAAHSAVTAGDAAAVNAAAHSIKGSVSPFAAKLAYDAAWQLEAAGTSGDLSKAPQLLATLESELQKLVDAIQSL